MKKSLLILMPALIIGLASCGGGNSSSSQQTSSSASNSQTSTSASTGSDSKSATSKSSSGSGEDEDLPDVEYNGKIRFWYHRDDMSYDDRVIYLWNMAVDGKEYEFTGKDEEYGAYFDIDLSTSEQFKDAISTDIRLIMKVRGTWSGQSQDTICEFKKFEVDENGVMNIYTAAAENGIVETYKIKDDALGDHFGQVYFADWRKIVATGEGTPNGRSDADIGKIAQWEVYEFNSEYYKLSESDQAKVKDQYLIKKGTHNSNSLTITLDKDMDPGCIYEVDGFFSMNTEKRKTKTAGIVKLYDTAKFKSDYTYDGDDLGLTFNADGSKTFKVWAPTSPRVCLRLYQDGAPAALAETVYGSEGNFSRREMERGEKGVWSFTLKEGDLAFKRKFYTYSVTNSAGTSEVCDPYAKSTGVNGVRAAILNFDDPSSKVDPEGWNDGASVDNSLPTIKSANNLTVYEAHIRDLTAHESWQSNVGNPRGTYNAFVEEGTTYEGNGKTVTTGFDHIKELGVNAIQLLPVFDQDNDERTTSNYLLDEEGNPTDTLNTKTYNWGYNPATYNVPEGAYSTDPWTPATKVREFKNLVQTAAKNGMRIIMDVVYNHMSSVANSAFTKLVPQYYFRTNAAGDYTDGSGCGNEVATERPMMSKFIADSVAYWAKEYRIKGFRFDLMGCIDINTMKAIRAAVNKIDPTIVLYGEGWTGGGSALAGDLQSGTYNVYTKLNTDAAFPIGGFNDCGRDGAKGNTVYDNVIPASGWINEGSNIDNVYNCLTQIIGENRWQKEGNANYSNNPNQTVNYLACHDNYTLYDQINYLFYSHDGSFGDPNHEYVMQAATSLTALSLFGQGVGFINGGDELFRQKIVSKGDYWFDELVASYGQKTATWDDDSGHHTKNYIAGDGIKIDNDNWLVRNSYKYGDAVNAFRWDRKTNAMVAKYYNQIKAAVALRNKEMGNTLGFGKEDVTGTSPRAYCWSYSDLFNEEGASKTDVLAGGFTGKKDSKQVYIFVNKGGDNAERSKIGIGNGTFDVLYSSGLAPRSGNITITNNSISIGKFETLIVRRTSGD